MLLGDVNVRVEYLDGNSKTRMGGREGEKKREKERERERCCEWELSGAPDEQVKSISSFCQYWDEGGRGCERYVARNRGRKKRRERGRRKEGGRKTENRDIDRQASRPTDGDRGKRDKVRERQE